MKKVLCFGDSNTFGYIPQSGKRYSKNERWSGILGNILENDFEIIESGCNNRTCFAQNPCGIEFIGYKILPKYLKNDIDIVVLALGINDVQFLYKTTAEDIKNGIEKLISTAKNLNENVKVLLVIPSVLTEDLFCGDFVRLFNKESVELSKEIPKIYKMIAKKFDCLFLDLNEYVKPSKKDGLHYEKEQHKIIAKKISEMLLKIK